MNLTHEKCAPCDGGVQPLNEEEVAKLLPEVKDWQVLENKKISKKFKFKDFVEAIGFINNIVPIAEEEGHHPDFEVHYNRVTVILWTHVIKGLSKNDFIMAAKIDSISEK